MNNSHIVTFPVKMKLRVPESRYPYSTGFIAIQTQMAQLLRMSSIMKDQGPMVTS